MAEQKQSLQSPYSYLPELHGILGIDVEFVR
jgi:hypothetical protein